MSGLLGWLQSPNCKLYCSHSLSAWGDRMWSFAIGLYMILLVPDSLILTAIYGFLRSGSVIAFGALIGKWIDRSPRVKAARVSIAIQNLAVCLCAVVLCVFLQYEEWIKTSGKEWMPIVAYLIIIIIACVGELASVATKITIEKDWIVVIASDDENLAKLNSTLRSIDLTTNILAPVLVGQIMTYISPFISAIFMAVWNLVSMIVEYHLLWHIYILFPKLAEKKTTPQADSGEDTTEAARGGENMTCWAAWQAYFQHPVVFAGLGLAALYMTVLSFGNVMSGYAYAQGLSESMVGILTGVGALFGIFGSLAYPAIRKRLNVERTGLFGFGLEAACLLLCVLSIWMPGSPFDPMYSNRVDTNNSSEPTPASVMNYTAMPLPVESSSWEYMSIAVLMAGVIAARFGLWVADLSVTQIMQEHIEESKRGVINGVQNSLNMSMDMLKFLLVMLLPNMETFGILIILSFVFVCLGWLLYALYSRKVRGHLFHFEKLFDYLQPEDVYGMTNNELLYIRDVGWEACAANTMRYYNSCG